MELNGKKVDVRSVELDGDYYGEVCVRHFFVSANWIDGTPLDDDEIEQLCETHCAKTFSDERRIY